MRKQRKTLGGYFILLHPVYNVCVYIFKLHFGYIHLQFLALGRPRKCCLYFKL